MAWGTSSAGATCSGSFWAGAASDGSSTVMADWASDAASAVGSSEGASAAAVVSPAIMASIWAMICSVLTSPSALVASRLSIIWRRASVDARITSIISDVTTMVPLRNSSRMFSDLCASWLILLRPRKPDAPLRECIGRKISFNNARLSGVFSSSSRLGSMVSRCSLASAIKSAKSSGSKNSWLIIHTFTWLKAYHPEMSRLLLPYLSASPKASLYYGPFFQAAQA